MIDFKTTKFNFLPTSGRVQSVTQAFVFDSAVFRAGASLNGFDIGFTQEDHHLFRQQVDITTNINNNTVNVTVNFALRDSSGNYDDQYSGWVDVLVIVDREEVNSPIRSGDQFALTAHNGQFVCAENGGGREVVANRNAIGPWEKFTITKL